MTKVITDQPTNHKWIDAHCHLTDERLYVSIEQTLKEAEAASVIGYFLGGVRPKEWQRQEVLRARYPNQIFTSFGIHPWEVCRLTQEEWDLAVQALKSAVSRAHALGETGLDFAPQFKDFESLQRTRFEEQLKIAASFQKPLVLHIVRAHQEAIRILSANVSRGGMIHSFSGDWQSAKRYMDMGFLLSISGSVTKDRTHFHECVKKIPLEFLVLETDSPDQAPIGISKGDHTPKSLLVVAEFVARLRGTAKETVLNQNTENLKRVFLLSL